MHRRIDSKRKVVGANRLVGVKYGFEISWP